MKVLLQISTDIFGARHQFTRLGCILGWHFKILTFLAVWQAPKLGWLSDWPDGLLLGWIPCWLAGWVKKCTISNIKYIIYDSHICPQDSLLLHGPAPQFYGHVIAVYTESWYFVLSQPSCHKVSINVIMCLIWVSKGIHKVNLYIILLFSIFVANMLSEHSCKEEYMLLWYTIIV